MRVKFLAPVETDAGLLPAGTTCEHPDCFLLADKGLAVDIDAEATEALKRWRAAKLSRTEDSPVPGFTFAGRSVPTTFTTPEGKVFVVDVNEDLSPRVTEKQPDQPEPVDA